MRRVCFFVVLASALVGCDSQDPVLGDPSDEHRISGIELRTELDTLLGILGEPGEQPGSGEGQLGLIGHPNPAVHLAHFEFSISDTSSVEMWIDRVEPTEAFHALVAPLVPAIPRGAESNVRQLVAEESHPAGLFVIVWDGLDDAGQPVGRGYFRVWLRVGAVTRSWPIIRVATDAERKSLWNSR